MSVFLFKSVVLHIQKLRKYLDIYLLMDKQFHLINTCERFH